MFHIASQICAKLSQFVFSTTRNRNRSVMFLSDTQFQTKSGVIEHVCLMLSRAPSLLSDNQPSLLQNTIPIQQPRLYIGTSLSFTQSSALRTFFSANRVARLAAFRHKTRSTATNSAKISRVVAVVGHSASAAAAATTTKRTVFRFAFAFTLHFQLCTLH
jgi:hypothetical protein